MPDGDNRRRRAHIDQDDPLRDLLDDPRDVARRRLKRRMGSRIGESSDAQGSSGSSSYRRDTPSLREENGASSRGAGSSSSRRKDGSSSRGENGASTRRSSRDALPEPIDHADLLDGKRDARSSRRRDASGQTGRISLPRPVVIALGVIVLVLLFAAVGAMERSCSAGPETASPIEIQTQAQENAQENQPEPEQADLSKIPASIDPEVRSALVELAASDERVAHAVNTIGDAVADETEQVKMLELAVEDPQAIDFVAGMAEGYPAGAGKAFDDAVEKGEIPLLMQWDERWGYTEYCGMSFASAGCCPTSLSMVYMGLTGKTDMTPYDMGVLATEGGYAVDQQGTIGDFLVDEASGLGLTCERFNPSANALLTYLQSGYTVICNVGPGDFTESGHFFVITGLDGDGKLEVNDPYSSVRSAKAWDVDAVVGQTIAFYAFKAA